MGFRKDSMSLTSKEMLESAKEKIKQAHKDLEIQKEELVGLENELKVEEKVLAEIKGEKDLSLCQEGAMTTVQSEIEMQKRKIADTEMDIKLLAKKIDVLSRDSWNF